MMKIVQKIIAKVFKNRIAVNVNSTSYPRKCLILYVVAPFLTQRMNYGHQNQWQVRELARIIGGFGYNVDVINFDNRNARLKKNYDLVVDLHPGLNDVYKTNMAPGCVRIAYITGSNPEFSNRAEAQRLADLAVRRGALLEQRRYAKPFVRDDLGSFDAMFFIGNAYNYRTYQGFNIKRLYYIRNNGIPLTLMPARGERSPASFLFLASGGQVHKGLDLLLEVFSRNKNLTLYVCSSFKAEKDFCRLYDSELFHTDNIKPIGFVDVAGAYFQRIAAVCSYVVLPSCSEANASSVLTGMSAGLIPIVSRECGFGEDEVHYFPDCSVESIAATLNYFAGMAPEWIKDEADKARSIVMTRYSGEAFTASVQAALKGVLDGV